MGRKYKRIIKPLIKFIDKQKIFFVATGTDGGKINLSPKGLDSFKVLSPNKIIWLNLTGSGNETADHLLLNDRITIMICSFEGNPMILRIYGSAKVYHEKDNLFKIYEEYFPDHPAKRQIIEVNISMVQTSCGFGVPLMEFKKERTELIDWSNEKGVDGIKSYWEEKNKKSIDGFDTQIIK